MQNEKNAKSEMAKKEVDKNETISELAHRHLLDETHTTSDEELRNAKVEFSEEPVAEDESLFETDNTTVTGEVRSDAPDDNDADDDTDSHKNRNPPNPYSVLDA